MSVLNNFTITFNVGNITIFVSGSLNPNSNDTLILKEIFSSFVTAGFCFRNCFCNPGFNIEHLV